MDKKFNYEREVAKTQRVDRYLNLLIKQIPGGFIERTRIDQIRIKNTLGPTEFLALCEETATQLNYHIPEYTLHIVQDGGDDLAWTITFTILDLTLVS